SVKPISIILLSFFAYFLVATRTLQFPFSIDDSYIDYRYVLNTLSGKFLEYNPGEKLIGFTSYVHICVLLVLSSVFHGYDISRLSQLFNCFTQLVAFFVAFPVLKKTFENEHLALFGTILLSSSADINSQGLLGKESSIILLLLLLLLYATRTQAPRLSAWCAALLYLTRPEGVVALFIVFLHSIKKGNLVKTWLGPAIVLLVWHAFLYFYFGSIIPHGGEAKRLAYAGSPPFVCLFNLLLHFAWMVNPFGWSANVFVEGSNLQKVLLILQGFLGISLIAYFSLRSSRIALLCQIALAMVAFYAIGNIHMFEWYLCWYQCLPMLISVSLLSMLLRAQRLKRVVPMIAALLVLHCVISPWFWPLLRRQGLFPVVSGIIFGGNQFDLRILPIKRATEYLVSTEGSSEAIASPEIGMLGYSYPGPILDTCGLVSDVLRFYRRKEPGEYTVPAELIRELKPKYLLAYDGFIAGAVLKDRWFHQAYKLKKSWPYKLWTSSELLLYERLDP
ncbi:MAG: hypothetical protein K2X93_20715, partial [Candidatus Obscuribacterales bacterium]|nr:hypothetical protein [Candidatus Obscuribacterales bacterium]